MYKHQPYPCTLKNEDYIYLDPLYNMTAPNYFKGLNSKEPVYEKKCGFMLVAVVSVAISMGLITFLFMFY